MTTVSNSADEAAKRLLNGPNGTDAFVVAGAYLAQRQRERELVEKWRREAENLEASALRRSYNDGLCAADERRKAQWLRQASAELAGEERA